MVTTDDVNRMRDQKDVEGLIQFLQSDNDPQIRKHAAFALGMVGDSRARVVLQNCILNDDLIVAGAASTALGQLEAKLATGMVGQAQRIESTRAKKAEKVELHQVKRWMVHRKLFLWIGVVILIGICVELVWMIQSAIDPSIWNMLPITIGPILGAVLFFNGLIGISRFKKQQITPLIEAVLKQNPDKVQSRIESGDNIKATDAARQTALHWASKYKSVKIVKLLLDAGVDVNAKDMNGVTPLQIAQKNANPGIIEALGGVPTEAAAQPKRKLIIHRKVLFWIGILMAPGMCVTESVMLDDSTWFSRLTACSLFVGVFFLVIAFFPKREPKKENLGEVETEFAVGDVLAMAIVYEGYVVENPDELEIAQELLKNFSDAGILEAVNLHPHMVIQMRRADEAAYYQGDYEPEDELPQMLEKGIVELKNRLEAEGRGLGKVKTRMVTLKGKSKIVSNCWVAMHIMQS